MDGYQFIASIVQSLVSLAWPAALVACVWLFRAKLNELLPLLKLKHGDWEASFRLDDAEKEAENLPPAPQIQPTPEEQSKFDTLADHAPRAAILEARHELEDAIKRLAFLYQATDSKNVSLLNAIRAMRAKGAIDEHVSAVLDDLRAIGNRAAHDARSEFTSEEAHRYRRLVDRVIADVSRTT
jgi:hypothetical protein